MPYAMLISQATGETDPSTIAVIEDLMRADRTALDALTVGEFAATAREALAELTALHAGGALVHYCAALGIAVPAWAA